MFRLAVSSVEEVGRRRGAGMDVVGAEAEEEKVEDQGCEGCREREDADAGPPVGAGRRVLRKQACGGREEVSDGSLDARQENSQAVCNQVALNHDSSHLRKSATSGICIIAMTCRALSLSASCIEKGRLAHTPNEMTAPSCRSREGSKSVAMTSMRRKASTMYQTSATRHEYEIASSPPPTSSS